MQTNHGGRGGAAVKGGVSGSNIPGILVAAALALLLALAAGCASKSEDSGGTDRPNPKLKTAELRVGPATIEAEIARTGIERERGLMFRTSVPDGTGMLFVFGSDQHLSFWMKNTLLPLSLAYISSDGTITQIVDLMPKSLEAVQSDRSVRYALEVPQGWFGRAGVKVGDQVRIPPLE
ncbi:MAG TPA: DUF192 domain-containing protein [Rectinemataceae bacterium]|nr:DUF192 domain-containing protein [Rectinemataceae bacterium]